jgi:hypothetical protein
MLQIQTCETLLRLNSTLRPLVALFHANIASPFVVSPPHLLPSSFTYDFDGTSSSNAVRDGRAKDGDAPPPVPRIPYLKMVAKVAEEIMQEPRPIRCPEAVYLGCCLTAGMLDLLRVPLRFQSKLGTAVHFHIVMAVGDTSHKTWGALGLSRVQSLMYKELRFKSLPDLVLDYVKAYQSLGHTVENISVGLPFSHDMEKMDRIEWIALVVPMNDGVAWKKTAEVFEQHARDMRALEEFYGKTASAAPRVVTWRTRSFLATRGDAADPSFPSLQNDAAAHGTVGKEGAVVEARFRGGDEYRRGTITRARSNGTYDISYDNGEKERSVCEALIRNAAEDGRCGMGVRREGKCRLNLKEPPDNNGVR